jgi:hypothetical protein
LGWRWRGGAGTAPRQKSAAHESASLGGALGVALAGVTRERLNARRTLRVRALRLEGSFAGLGLGDGGAAQCQKNAARESAALGGALGLLLAGQRGTGSETEECCARERCAWRGTQTQASQSCQHVTPPAAREATPQAKRSRARHSPAQTAHPASRRQQHAKQPPKRSALVRSTLLPQSLSSVTQRAAPQAPPQAKRSRAQHSSAAEPIQRHPASSSPAAPPSEAL